MVTALIPARGGSKRLPRKNIAKFCGKPLIYWTISAALNSTKVTDVIVSTDDHEIAAIAEGFGASVPFMRPQQYATDSSSGLDPVIHALELLPTIDDVLLLQPTSPLRTTTDIDSIIELRRNRRCSSAVSVMIMQKPPTWTYNLDSDSKLSQAVSELPLQAGKPFVCLNGALYLSSRYQLLQSKSFIAEDTVAYVMPSERSVDIDTHLDFKFAQFLMTTQNEG